MQCEVRAPFSPGESLASGWPQGNYLRGQEPLTHLPQLSPGPSVFFPWNDTAPGFLRVSGMGYVYRFVISLSQTGDFRVIT